MATRQPISPGATPTPPSACCTGWVRKRPTPSRRPCTERGIILPLLRSGNVDGGHDWNGQVMTEYANRIFYRHQR